MKPSTTRNRGGQITAESPQKKSSSDVYIDMSPMSDTHIQIQTLLSYLVWITFYYLVGIAFLLRGSGLFSGRDLSDLLDDGRSNTTSACPTQLPGGGICGGIPHAFKRLILVYGLPSVSNLSSDTVLITPLQSKKSYSSKSAEILLGRDLSSLDKLKFILGKAHLIQKESIVPFLDNVAVVQSKSVGEYDSLVGYGRPETVHSFNTETINASLIANQLLEIYASDLKMEELSSLEMTLRNQVNKTTLVVFVNNNSITVALDPKYYPQRTEKEKSVYGDDTDEIFASPSGLGLTLRLLLNLPLPYHTESFLVRDLLWRATGKVSIEEKKLIWQTRRSYQVKHSVFPSTESRSGILFGSCLLVSTSVALMTLVLTGRLRLVSWGVIGTSLMPGLALGRVRGLLTVIGDTEEHYLAETAFLSLMGGIIGFLITCLLTPTSPGSSLSVSVLFRSPPGILSSLALLIISTLPIMPWEIQTLVIPSLFQLLIVLMAALSIYAKDYNHRDEVIGSSFLLLVLTRFILGLDSENSLWTQLISDNIPTFAEGLGFFTPLACLFVGLMVRRHLHNSDNLNGTASMVAGIFVPIGLLLSSMFWVIVSLSYFPGIAEKFGPFFGNVRFVAVRIGFFACGLSTIYAWISDANTLGLEILNVPVPEPSKSNPQRTRNTRQLHLRGLANVVGSGAFVFMSTLVMTGSFFGNPETSLALCLGFLQVIQVMDLFHLWRDKVVLAREGETPATNKKAQVKKSIAEMIKEQQQGQTTLTRPVSTQHEVDAQAEETRLLAYRRQSYPGTAFFFVTMLVLIGLSVNVITRNRVSLDTVAQSFRIFSVHVGGAPTMSSPIKGETTLISRIPVWPLMQLIAHLYTFDVVIIGMGLTCLIVWKRPFLRGREMSNLTELGLAVFFFAAFVGVRLSVTAVLTFNGVSRMPAKEQWFLEAVAGVMQLAGCQLGILGVWMALKAFSGFQIRMRQMGLTS